MARVEVIIHLCPTLLCFTKVSALSTHLPETRSTDPALRARSLPVPTASAQETKLRAPARRTADRRRGGPFATPSRRAGGSGRRTPRAPRARPLGMDVSASTHSLAPSPLP